jgi:hypothetical protein
VKVARKMGKEAGMHDDNPLIHLHEVQSWVDKMMFAKYCRGLGALIPAATVSMSLAVSHF